MDAGVVDEIDDGLIALLVLVAQVLSQVDEQLSAHGLVAMHVGDVLKLRLTCREQKDTCCVTMSQTELLFFILMRVYGSEQEAEHKTQREISQ